MTKQAIDPSHFKSQKAGVSPGLLHLIFKPLALRELEAAAGFCLAVFLAFNNAAVAREKPTFFQSWSQVWFKQGKGAGDAVAHGTGLT